MICAIYVGRYCTYLPISWNSEAEIQRDGCNSRVDQLSVRCGERAGFTVNRFEVTVYFKPPAF